MTISPNKRFIVLLLSATLLMLLPLILMQFTDQVNWALNDFLIMGGLLAILVSVVELVFRYVKKRRQRLLLCLALLFVFLLIWAELGVGIFGSPIAGS